MKRASLLLLVSIAACSGCAGRQPAPVIVPQVVGAAECPAPEAPVLPAVDGTILLDHPDNMRTLLERDDLTRGYIESLRLVIRCYRAQVVGR